MNLLQDAVDHMLDDQQFESIKSAIANAREESEDYVKSTSKPSMRSRMQAQQPEMPDLALIWEVVKEGYRNECWEDVLDALHLLQAQGWPAPAVAAGRIPLCEAVMGNFDNVFHQATEAYESYPVDAAPYLAIGLFKESVWQPEQALRWFELASVAKNAPPHFLKKCIARAKKSVLRMEMEEKIVLPYITRPNLIELLPSIPEFKDIILPDLEASLRRIQSDPSSLHFERGHCQNVNLVVTSLAATREILCPDTPTSDEVVAMIQNDSPFHCLGTQVFDQLVQHLPLKSIVALQTTSKLTRYWANRPEVWNNLYQRLWEPVTEEYWGGPLPPYINKFVYMGRSFLMQLIHSLTDILETRKEMESLESQIRDKIDDLCSLYHATHPSSALFIAFLEALEIISSSKTRQNLASVFSSGQLVSLLVYTVARGRFEDYNSVAETRAAFMLLTALVLVGKTVIADILVRGGLKVFCRRLLYEPVLAPSAGALLAALLAEQSKVGLPPSLERIDFRKFVEGNVLNGVWHASMFWGPSTHIDIMEKSVLKLSFNADTGEITGSGQDTMGAFKIVDGSVKPGTSEILWTQDYSTHAIRFTGEGHPYGFAGCYSIIPTDQEPDQCSGCWISYKDPRPEVSNDDWRIMSAELKASATKRKNGKFPEPWKASPGILDSIVEVCSHAAKALRPNTGYFQLLDQMELVKQSDPNGASDSVDVPLERGAHETEKKHSMRVKVFNFFHGVAMELRTRLGVERFDELDRDVGILQRRPNDEAALIIIDKWSDYLCLCRLDDLGMQPEVESILRYHEYVKQLIDAHPELKKHASKSKVSHILGEDEDTIDAEAIAAGKRAQPRLSSGQNRYDSDEDYGFDDEGEGDDGFDEEAESFAKNVKKPHSKQASKRQKSAEPSTTSIFIVAGVLAAVGIGAYLLRNLWLPKRSSSSSTKK